MIRNEGSFIKGKNINIQILHNQNLENSVGVGYTASKKIGNAVKRNKIKRKLKSAVQEILNNNIIDLNYTYIIFGKNNVYKDKFKLVVDEVNKIFNKINKYAWNY